MLFFNYILIFFNYFLIYICSTLVLTDFETILYQNIPQSNWHAFDKTDLANFVREQLALPEYYGSIETALKLQIEIVEYLT